MVRRPGFSKLLKRGANKVRATAPRRVVRAAARAGTKLHADICAYLTRRESPSEPDAAWGHFLKFLATFPEYKFTKNEWRVGKVEDGLHGIVDAVVERDLGDNLVERSIIEFKRCSDPTRVYSSGNMRAPFEDLPDTQLSHWAVQLSAQRLAIERYEDLTIHKAYVVVLHPAHPTFLVYRCPYVREGVLLQIAHTARRPSRSGEWVLARSEMKRKRSRK
jgi:hypothetical protein